MSAKPAQQISARKGQHTTVVSLQTQTQHCGFRAAKVQLIFYSCKKNVINTKIDSYTSLAKQHSRTTRSKKTSF